MTQAASPLSSDADRPATLYFATNVDVWPWQTLHSPTIRLPLGCDTTTISRTVRRALQWIHHTPSTDDWSRERTQLSIRLEDIFRQCDYSGETADRNFVQIFLNADVGNHAENTEGEEYLGSDFPDELCEVFHYDHSPESHFPSMYRLAATPRATRMAVEAAATNTLRFNFMLPLPAR